jgi:hypothetical protein
MKRSQVEESVEDTGQAKLAAYGIDGYRSWALGTRLDPHAPDRKGVIR